LAGQQVAESNAVSFATSFDAVVTNVERFIQGKRDAIHLALVCMLAEGHLLIEDVPGVGKTSLAKAMARSIDCEWHRIQFTPVLLPSDVTGVTVYNRASGAFEFRPGGVFANIVLGDEINRASPKTQSALLEAMEERQVTVDATTYRLPSPFMVIATQNPIEHEGTYALPESQLDRFLMRIRMGYPDRTQEVEMLETHAGGAVVEALEPVLSAADVESMIRLTQAVHVAPSLKAYIVDLAASTRTYPTLALGMSPRSSLALLRAARAHALALGREYVVPDDLKAMAGPVLEHRLMLTPESQLSGLSPAEVIDDILNAVPVPTSRNT
jgi:MoxR-like ATPase